MRDAVRIGDPGINVSWARRRSAGIALTSIWAVVSTLSIAVGAAVHAGIFGRIEGWQAQGGDAYNPVLAALPFLLFLPFLPALLLLLPVDVSHPFRLGVQQAFSPEKGPRFDPGPDVALHRMTTAIRVAGTTVLAGMAALAGGVAWAIHAGSQPVPPAVRIAYADVVRAGADLPDRIEVTGAIEARPTWTERAVVRNSTSTTEWRPIVAPSSVDAPAALVESIVVGTREDGAPKRYVTDKLVGRVRPLDRWTADRLREAGFRLSARPLVLTRSMGHQGDIVDASADGMLVAMAGFVAVVVGGAFWWQMTRQRATFR